MKKNIKIFHTLLLALLLTLITTGNSIQAIHITHATKNLFPAAYHALSQNNHFFSTAGSYNQRQPFFLKKTDYIDPQNLPVIKKANQSLWQSLYTKLFGKKNTRTTEKNNCKEIDHIENGWNIYSTLQEKNKNTKQTLIKNIKNAYKSRDLQKIKELKKHAATIPGSIKIIEPTSNLSHTFTSTSDYITKAQQWQIMIKQLTPSLWNTIKEKLTHTPISPTGGISVSGPTSIFNWVLPNFSLNLGGLYNPQKIKNITINSPQKEIVQYLGSLGHNWDDILDFIEFKNKIEKSLIIKREQFNTKKLTKILHYFCM